MKTSSKAQALAALLGVSALFLPLPTQAGNGHFIHGAGAVHSSMGGAGVGLPHDVLAALFHNPALLARLEGHQMAFGVELVQSDASVTSTVPTPFGPFVGSTEDDSDAAPIPAVGWSRKAEGSRIAYGFGFLGLAGFSTDYPQDSSNPILLPQPSGFGGVFANYSLLQIPFAVAWEVNPKLALGVALNAGWATLEASPFGGVTPDCSSPVDCYFPSLNQDGSFGFGFQLGLHYQINDTVGLGLAYSSPQSFQDFSWNTSVANPNLPTFGTQRRVRFSLDAPQFFSVGLGFEPGERWSIALDGRWINYTDTDGFEGGLDPATGLPRGLGWDDILVLAAGAEYRFPSGVAVRFGYNLSEAAVTSDSAFFNVQSPANFEDHYTVGLGVPLYDKLDLNLGYYHVPSNAVGGPFQSPFGPVPGTRVDNEISVDSVLVTFSFKLE